MDALSMIELLTAAGYKVGHAHLGNVPPGRPDKVLIVFNDKDQLPPMTGLIEHIESEEYDPENNTVIASIQRRMENHRLLPAPNGGCIWVYLDIAVECSYFEEDVKEPNHANVAVNSRGSGALN